MSIFKVNDGTGSFPFGAWRRPGFWPVLAVCLFLLLPACSDSQSQQGNRQGSGEAGRSVRPVPVSVSTSIGKDMPLELEAIGTVEPFATVGIKSQITGILEKVNFREGDRVKAGELLFGIDPRPFAAALNQAEATLAKDRAALDNARKQAERYQPAAEKGYVSQEQADQAQTSVATLAAAVQADEAAVESARLDLDNCTIRSPITGFTGRLLADTGNLVKAMADQPLVTVNQVDPVKIAFSMPEQSVPELKKYLAKRGVKVTAIPGDSSSLLPGEFSFMDNAVDSASGTILLKAVFANPDLRLWPGQFVKVRLRLTTLSQVTVVPSRAVQTGQAGAYLYVVGNDLRVEERPVQVGISHDDESVIKAGLVVGEMVVTDGQLRLKPGALVKPLAANDKVDGSDTEQ